jgi:hypothetical protein
MRALPAPRCARTGRAAPSEGDLVRSTAVTDDTGVHAIVAAPDLDPVRAKEAKGLALDARGHDRPPRR